MKVYRQTDLEGCAGFCFYHDFQDKSPEAYRHYYSMCRFITNEMNAAVKAACGAWKVKAIRL